MRAYDNGARPTANLSYLTQILLLVLVLLVALFFRTYNLALVPPGLDGDEMFNGWDALRVWKGHQAVYFAANFGREPLLIYLIAVTTRLLGMGAWTMRLASVLCGLVGLACTWLLARRLFNSRIAILATALMAVSLWPVLLNRVALRAGLQPVIQVIAVYALWRALEDRDNRWAVAAGLFTGLNLYTYTASRVFPVVLVFWLGLSALSSSGRHLLRDNAKRLITVGVTAGLVAAPLVIFALQQPELVNQRVDELSYELNQLRAGNPEPIWQSVRLTLGMFTQSGDREWRYNPSGRPVFDSVTGGLFYLGLLVTMFRTGGRESASGQKRAYLLLLVWLFVMLVPSILSIGTPSFWRAVGALTPIYLMPAIGADFVWEWIVRWGGRAGQVALTVAATAGLILVGIDTWHDYFNVWSRHPQVLHTFEADLAAAARYLNTYTASDTPVWVSSDFPSDLSRRLLGLQSNYPGPVRWFDGNSTTVWPAGWADQDILLIFTRSSPPNPDALAILKDYLVYHEIDNAGRPHLWVYQVPGEALSEMPWQPAHTLSGRFAYNREILGYDAPTRIQRQTDVAVVVYWRVPEDVEYDPADPPRSFICLEDQAGRCWEKVSHFQSYPLWDWTTGDIVAQRYIVSVPAQMPPQTAYLRIGMFTSVGEVSFAEEERAGAPLIVGPVNIEGSASLTPQWSDDTPIFNQELALINYQVPDDLPPGSTLEVALQWQALQAPRSDYSVELALRDPRTGEQVLLLKEILGSERHPSSRWTDGEPVHTFHRMFLPADLGNDDFEVYLTLSETTNGQTIGSPLFLGTLTVVGRAHNFELPAPEYPLVADFGSSIRLLGFDLRQMDTRPGGQIEVVLYWQALSTIDDDYKVFVHLYHPSGESLTAQHDNSPGNGAFPTSGWLPGEVVADPHLVTIPSDAAIGVSQVGIGLYHPVTGERLTLSADDHAQVNNSLIITEAEIQ